MPPLADLKDIYSKATLGAGWWRHRVKALPRGMRGGGEGEAKPDPERQTWKEREATGFDSAWNLPV